MEQLRRVLIKPPPTFQSSTNTGLRTDMLWFLLPCFERTVAIQRSGCFMSCFTLQKSPSLSRYNNGSDTSEPASVPTNQVAATLCVPVTHTGWTRRCSSSSRLGWIRWGERASGPERQLQKSLGKIAKGDLGGAAVPRSLPDDIFDTCSSTLACSLMVSRCSFVPPNNRHLHS